MSTTPVGLILDLPESAQATYVPWAQTTYALFGKNGVGKTRRLEAIRQLFQGGTEINSHRYLFDASGRAACSVIVEASMPEPYGEDENTRERASELVGGVLGSFLERVHPRVSMGVEAGVARDRYEEHILDALRQNDYGDDAEAVFKLVRQQRYFEITRDELDRLVVRPCYLESPEHPELSAHLVELSRESEEEGMSSLEWSPLASEALATLEGGQISFAHIGVGDFVMPRFLDVTEATGHTCTDVRANTEPDTAEVRRQLARLLDRGADLAEFAEELSREATRQLHRALPTSVDLRLHVPSHSELLKGGQVQWFAAIPDTNDVFRTGRAPLDRLSEAERTWAILAIHRATASLLDTRPSILLLDEPEQGLHRGAERVALDWLAELGHDPRTWLWCATHSPVLLGDGRVDPVAVQVELQAGPFSTERRTTMRLLGAADKEELDALGLNPTDLLSTRRGFLLVEGPHDEIVLTELVGTELARLNVEIIPLYGGKNLPGAIEARTLFDFTDALLLALLDAIPSAGLAEAWEEARKHADDLDKAWDVLTKSYRWPDKQESGWMKQWLMRSIDRGRGRHSRVLPLGLSKADIIEYLPVQHFVATATSWDDLRAEHEASLANSQRTPKDFKRWLEMAHGADTNSLVLRRACGALDHIPTDFTDLVDGIRAGLDAYETQKR